MHPSNPLAQKRPRPMAATKPARTRPSTASAPAPLAGTVPPAEVDAGAPALERVVVVAVSVSVAVSVAEGKSAPVSVFVSVAEGKMLDVSNGREVAEAEESVRVSVAGPEPVEGAPTPLICAPRFCRQHPVLTRSVSEKDGRETYGIGADGVAERLAAVLEAGEDDLGEVGVGRVDRCEAGGATGERARVGVRALTRDADARGEDVEDCARALALRRVQERASVSRHWAAGKRERAWDVRRRARWCSGAR
jgi:hypothetical protein